MVARLFLLVWCHTNISMLIFCWSCMGSIDLSCALKPDEVAILQTTFSNQFCCIHLFLFLFKFHSSLFPMVDLFCWWCMGGCTSLVPHLISPPSHWFPISLVPHLIGPPISLIPQLAPMHHSFHWSPISLVPPTHWSPISLAPQFISPPIHKSPTTLFELIGPPSHWSPFSLVHPFSANPNGPPSHRSAISLVPQLAPTHRPFHWPPISLVPHPIGPFALAGPPIHKSPPHCLNSMAPFSLVPPCNPFYPVLICPPSHR